MLVQRHISKHLFILLRVKLKDLFIRFIATSFLEVYETAKLMDFAVKACGTSMLHRSWPLPFNATIFTSAFDLHWLCDEALSHFTHQATALLILTRELQTEQRYVCISVWKNLWKESLPSQFFHKRRH